MGISFDNIVDILHNKKLIGDNTYNRIKIIKGDSEQLESTLDAINSNWEDWYSDNKGAYPDVDAFFKGTKMTPISGCGFIDSRNQRCIGIKNRIKELYNNANQPQEGGKKRGKKTKKATKKGKKKTLKKKGKKKTKKANKKGKKKTLKKKGKKSRK